MGIIEAIRKGFGVAGKVMGLVAVLIIFNLIWSFASMPFAIAPGAAPTPQATTAALLFSVVFILISIFIQGGSIAVVRDHMKSGNAKLAAFAGYGLKYYLRLLALGILIVLMIAVVALIAGVLVAVTAPLNNPVIMTIAVIIAVGIGIVLGLLYFIPLTLSPYALVCDDLNVIEAMKRSLRVTKKPFARVLTLFALFILLMLIALGVGFAVGFIVGLISAFIPPAAGKALMAVATSIVNGYLGVVMMAAVMAFYLSLKEKVG